MKMKNFTQKFTAIFALVFTMSFTVNSQEIGDIYQGGYIFQINEDGTGLVADLQDLGEMYWWDAIDAAESATSQGYDDWYLPSIEELELMYSTIGHGGGNIGGFADYYYWSSSENSNYGAWVVGFGNGTTTYFDEYNPLRVRVIRSVAFGEDENTEDDTTASTDTTDNFLDLPEGWSMFGYTCIDSVDAMVSFSEISDKIEIVKDEWGLSYLPSWEFNAMGSLQFSEGYQIKMIEEVTDFQFCEAIVPEDGITQADVDAAFDEGAASVTPEDGVSQSDLDAVHAMYEGWCASDLDNDGICDVDEVWGCMDASSCNYVSSAEFDDSSCEYTSCLDDCGVINGDNSTCLDCAGVVNGTSEDLGCGCGNPAAQEGYDCDGNEIVVLQIGDQHAGGIVFQINEDGTGLVADLQDLGEMYWWYAIDAAESATSQGYDDWYLPSIEELELMYSTIGHGGGDIGGFADYYYWSSSENSNYGAWVVGFGNGTTTNFDEYNPLRVRVIRAF